MEFFPSVNQQQTEDNFSKTFLSRDLPEIVTFRKAQAAQNTKNSLHRMVREAIEEEKPVKEIILEIKESISRTSIQEQDAIVMVCTYLSKLMFLRVFTYGVAIRSISCFSVLFVVVHVHVVVVP